MGNLSFIHKIDFSLCNKEIVLLQIFLLCLSDLPLLCIVLILYSMHTVYEKMNIYVPKIIYSNVLNVNYHFMLNNNCKKFIFSKYSTF